MEYFSGKILLMLVITVFLLNTSTKCWALASNNIPLDSPIYFYLEKLEAFGLVATNFKGIRPYSRAETARLVTEAEKGLDKLDGRSLVFAERLLQRLKELLPREVGLYKEPDKAPSFDYNPFVGARLRYVYLDGVPRSYERPVDDPGGDGVFGIGSGLRPVNPYPTAAQQHGTEGTPLLENNDGIVYHSGNNVEFRLIGEAYIKSFASALIEPLFLYSRGTDSKQFLLNEGYLKLGGKGLELEVGRDENWLGTGYRGAITMTNNARNLDIVKISSPEPITSKYLWDLKYALIVSRLDDTVINGQERRPYFMAAKLSFLPNPNVEFGINYGKEFGGPGVNNSLSAYLKGIFGGTNSDNTNNLAGMELRLRLPFLRNTEIYGEFSGEDSALFWPIVESYVAGFFVPCLTSDGKNDLRFEYFLGNSILYTNGTFPEGYLYRGMPIGDSQGGAAKEFFVRYSHWFSIRNRLALEYYHTERGNLGRLPVDASGQVNLVDGVMQAVERKNSMRAFWDLPLHGDFDLQLMYGWERINNLNLMAGVDQTNQIFKLDVSYRY